MCLKQHKHSWIFGLEMLREKLFVDVFDNKACALLPWADTLRRTGLLWVWME